MKMRNSIGSIWGLVTSHTVVPTLTLVCILFVIQGMTFLFFGWNQGDSPLSLYQWIDCVVIKYSFIGVLFIAVGISARAGSGKGKSEYTINRLGVSQQKLYGIWMLNTGCVILIIWSAQLLMFLLACKYYNMVTAENLTSVQTAFLTTYQSDFIHYIIPLEDWKLWIGNLGIWIFLSAEAAYYAVQRFKGERSLVHILAVFMVLAYFIIGNGIWSMYLVVFLFVCAAFFIHGGMSDEI